jgi:hypothetical protein
MLPDDLHYPLTLYFDGARDSQVLSNGEEMKNALRALPANTEAMLQEEVQGQRVSQYILDAVPYLSTGNDECLETAIKAYQLLEARGLTRFDFIKSDELYLTGIEISPDPLDEDLLQKAAAAGRAEGQLLQTLVEHAGSDLWQPHWPRLNSGERLDDTRRKNIRKAITLDRI